MLSVTTETCMTHIDNLLKIRSAILASPPLLLKTHLVYRWYFFVFECCLKRTGVKPSKTRCPKALKSCPVPENHPSVSLFLPGTVLCTWVRYPDTSSPHLP